MKLMFATLAVALVGLGGAGTVAAEGDPPPCVETSTNPWHPTCPPDPHAEPPCVYHCPPPDNCKYERRITWQFS